jgi:TolA-binding protein
MMAMKKQMTKILVIGSVIFFLFSTVMAQEDSYNKALKSYAKKDYRTAAKYFREYVEKNPDPAAYYLLGYAMYKMKKHAESVKYFKEAYLIDPDISLSSAKRSLKKKK